MKSCRTRILAESLIAKHYGIERTGRLADDWLLSVCRWAWRVKLRLSIETDLLEEIRERAEETAIGVFGENLRDLLLAAPAGHYAVLGPGSRLSDRGKDCSDRLNRSSART